MEMGDHDVLDNQEIEVIAIETARRSVHAQTFSHVEEVKVNFSVVSFACIFMFVKKFFSLHFGFHVYIQRQLIDYDVKTRKYYYFLLSNSSKCEISYHFSHKSWTTNGRNL